MTQQQVEQIGPVGFVTPLTEPPAVEPAPEPDETWPLPGGTAWIYRGRGNSALQRPVILADGFNTGPSDLDWLWDGLERKQFPFISQLRDRGRDLVLVGFDERSAPIQRNADVVIAAVLRAVAERLGNTRLLVGGFSMGGMVTRYALAKLEHQRMDHQTAVYLSYDSPHRGSWVPIALQAFAHFVKRLDPTFSDQINSPASRQMLWRHIADVDGTPGVDPLRTQFLAELDQLGGWPRIPRLLGIANGTGNGVGNKVPPGVEALTVTGPLFRGTTLYTQAGGRDRVVAELRSLLASRTIRTNDLPDIDGAPGGTLESFGILGRELNRYGEAEVYYPSVCFVPSVSAVAIRNLDTNEDLYTNIDSLPPDQSELDDFVCAGDNEPHTVMTEQFGTWILDRLPD